MSAIKVKVPGTPVVLGGQTYILPPLPLGFVEDNLEALQQVDPTRGDRQTFGFIIDAVYVALQRNYPEITRDALRNLMDLGNVASLFQALVNVSGLVDKVEEPVGEA